LLLLACCSAATAAARWEVAETILPYHDPVASQYTTAPTSVHASLKPLARDSCILQAFDSCNILPAWSTLQSFEETIYIYIYIYIVLQSASWSAISWNSFFLD
jgi:hypothetical protein